MNPDVIVIGGGAAGLMCAITAARRGRSVVVAEHNDRPANKILISGGGRCNFTNTGATADNYLSRNPDFCKSALARFTPHHFIEWVERHGIAYHEKKLGQLFCDDSSRRIADMLLRECHDSGVKIQLNTRVDDVEPANRFRVQTSRGPMETTNVVVATGGLSFPKLGTSDVGHRIAQRFGLEIIPTRPALVPLTFSRQDLDLFKDLSGISLDVNLSCGKKSFREQLLFTHRGVSGPAVLQISSYWKEGQPVTVDLSPDFPLGDWLASKQHERTELVNVLSLKLPRRFVQIWCERHAHSRPMNQIAVRHLREIAAALHCWQLRPAGTEGYQKAEVTLGGVCTSGLSSKTMGAKNVPGLYFVGEVVDVTGHLGGYNFQWAWASGAAAGSNI